MVVDNFIKMGPDYINWSANVTGAEVELVKVLGTGSIRKIAKYKVMVRDLLDTLLFRCHGFRKFAEELGVDLQNSEEPIIYKTGGYTVTLENNNYLVTFGLKDLKTLIRINRATSKWNDVKDMPRVVMDVETLVEVLDKVIRLSILKFSPKASNTKKLVGSGVVITNAFIDSEKEEVHISLDKTKVDVLTPDNQYNTKYLVDSFVLGSEYCKNLHSFISYFADVFKRQAWSNKMPYNYTAIATVAEAMGVRFDPEARDYNKETNCYARTNVVQFVKQYVKEINEKTRLSTLMGELDYEIIREKESRGKVKGFKFFFKEA